MHCKYKNATYHLFLIVLKKVIPILGLAACGKLNVEKHIFALQEHTEQGYEILIAEYQDLFVG